MSSEAREVPLVRGNMSEIRDKIVELYNESGGNVTRVADAINVARGTVYYHLKKSGIKPQVMSEGQVSVRAPKKQSLPKRGRVRRYILTSAQNNTHVHVPVFNNLVALADHYDAQMIVGTFTYNQNRYGPMSVKMGKSKAKETRLWYAPEITQYIRDESVALAPGLVWCGEMNTLPTATDPLRGFEVYTGRASGIFPHAKVAMRSVASGTASEPTKFNYTTGTLTQRNYVAKRAGLRAQHNHSYGGLLVEVNHDGTWWVRQLCATEDGEIRDLDLRVRDGAVTPGHRVAAITWGDLHTLLLRPRMLDVMESMLDHLRPKRQFVHDLLLGAVTNHHERKNHHERFRRHTLGGGWSSLTSELREAARVLDVIGRDGCETVVVDSNHDRPWLERWLRETDGRDDPENAMLWFELNLALYQSVAQDPTARDFHVLEHAMRALGLDEDVRFLRADQSYTVTASRIECGMHGHLGPNGSRGHPRGLSKLGRKGNTCHTHSAGIWDGLYVGGMSCDVDMGYNSGPSSWSQSNIVTYPNGKRSIVTVWDDRWRA